MKPNPVELVPHDPEWSRKYAKEVPILKGVFLENLVSLHHIGSTSIPGILAKPIIDILGAVKSLDEVDKVVGYLEELGFRAHGEMNIPGRRYFTRIDNSVHLHIFKEGDPQLARHLTFCEFLIAHPEKAKAYEELKKQCASKFADNSLKYAESKTQFVRQMDEEAALWKESTCE